MSNKLSSTTCRHGKILLVQMSYHCTDDQQSRTDKQFLFFYSKEEKVTVPKQCSKFCCNFVGYNLSGCNWQPTGMFDVLPSTRPPHGRQLNGHRGERWSFSFVHVASKYAMARTFHASKRGSLIGWSNRFTCFWHLFLFFLFLGYVYFCPCSYLKKKEIRFLSLLGLSLFIF